MHKPASFTDTSDDPSYFLAAFCGVGGAAASFITKSPSHVLRGAALAAAYGYTGFAVRTDDDQYGHLYGAASSTAMSLGALPRALRTSKALPMALVVFGALNTAYYGRKYYDIHIYDPNSN